MINIEPTSLPVLSKVQGRAIRIRSDRDGWSGEVFVCVPASHADLLSSEEDAFLPLVAVLALARGEDLDLRDAAVDAALLRNVSAALRQHAAWHRKARAPAIHNARAVHERRQPAPGSAVLFSGGVDSQFSLVRHTEGRSAEAEASLDRDLDFALHVLPATNPGDLDPSSLASSRLEAAVRALGVELVPVWTNMMTFSRELNARWGDLGHGAGWASVLHLLGGGIGTGLIASSDSYGDLEPWGSSPITDPLYSGSGVRIIHDGSTFSRVEKTRVIAQSPAALASLNVCDKLTPGVGYVNCGRCHKCLRTMITLDLLGKGSNRDCSSFGWKDYDPEQYGRVLLQHAEVALAREIGEAARGVRPDIEAACAAAIRKSLWLRPLAVAESRLRASRIGHRYRKNFKDLRDLTYRRIGMLR